MKNVYLLYDSVYIYEYLFCLCLCIYCYILVTHSDLEKKPSSYVIQHKSKTQKLIDM